MSVSHFELYKPNSRPSSGKGPHNEPSNQEKMGVGKGRLESQVSNTSNQNSLCPLPASQPHPFVSVSHQTPLSKLKTLESFSSPIWSPIWSQNLPLVSPAPLTLPQLNSIVSYAWSPSETWISPSLFSAWQPGISLLLLYHLWFPIASKIKFTSITLCSMHLWKPLAWSVIHRRSPSNTWWVEIGLLRKTWVLCPWHQAAWYYFTSAEDITSQVIITIISFIII